MKETLIDYMKRRLKEYREMKPEKTLPVERDFPNCNKYDKCCTDEEKPEIDLTRRCFHCGQQFQDDISLSRHMDMHRETDGGVRSIG